MSETSRTDDSAPSLSSYPPAFVTLITTFIKRAEEAEIRAHKALVILRTKDKQVIQLQQRMEVLEKIAARLEEVMVPPLELPPSPSTTEDLGSRHPRDTTPEANQQPEHTPCEILYERYPTAHLRMERGITESQEVHNCYTRCQHLIDGLERSNSQLREALIVESQQRVQDHEQYVATIAELTQAVKDWKLRGMQEHSQPEPSHLQDLGGESVSKSAVEDTTSVLKAPMDNMTQSGFKGDFNHNSLLNKNEAALLVNEELQKKVDLAEHIIKTLQKRLEKGQIKKSFRRIRRKKSKIAVKSSSDSLSYRTASSSPTMRPRIKHCSSHLYFNSLKRKNKQLKIKFYNICERYKETLSCFEKIHTQLISNSKRNKVAKNDIEKVEAFTQTDRLRKEDANELLHNDTKTNLIQGRLTAASKVMANQQKQLREMQQQLINSQCVADSLRKRLARAEGSLVGQTVSKETARREAKDAQDRNNALSREVQQLKEKVYQLTHELASKAEINSKIQNEKDECEKQLESMMKTMDLKLGTLESTLQKRDKMSEEATDELQLKLVCLREQFVAQLSEARSRLEAADMKIQQLYLGIETFLKLLFELQRTKSTALLSPSSQEQALQVASNILQLQPAQIQTILHSSRDENHKVHIWLRYCNQLVHNDVFANNLGHFLLEAVLDTKLS